MKDRRAEKPNRSGNEIKATFLYIKHRWDDTVIAVFENGVTARGRMDDRAPFIEGHTYRLMGMEETTKWGKQFRFNSYVETAPHGRVGIARYLQRYAPGIGDEKANKLFDLFGTDAVDTFIDHTEKVVKAGILNRKQAELAAHALRERRAFQQTAVDLMELLDRRGMPLDSTINTAIFLWGTAAAQKIRENPFVLIENRFYGCGFRRVDRMYLELGLDPAAMVRQANCALYAVNSDRDGHTWHRVSTVYGAIRDMISGSRADPVGAVRYAIENKLLTLYNPKSKIEKRKGWLAEPRKAASEASVANSIRELIGHTQVIWQTSGKLPLLSDEQNAELAKATSLPVGILTGTPGTGKTFTLAAFVRFLLSFLPKDRIAVVAPTGKAAVRCSEALYEQGIKDFQATTIHRRLGVKGIDKTGSLDFVYTAGEFLPVDVVIVDETSMTDVDLLARLLAVCRRGTHVLFVGDPFQLPPVGHGAPLRDMIEVMPSHGHLSTIRRNAGLIVKACKAIKDGLPFETCDQYRPKKGQNLMVVEAATPVEIAYKLGRILRIATEDWRWDIYNDIQVVTAVNAKGESSRKALNHALQGIFNGNTPFTGTNPIKRGDKVICLKNSRLQPLADAYVTPALVERWDREGRPLLERHSAKIADYRPHLESTQEDKVFVANGEIGRALAVDEKQVVAHFPNPDRIVKFFAPKKLEQNKEAEDDGKPEPDEEVGDLDLGYAITCHKAQGSGYKLCIEIADPGQGANFVCSREWHYTAISRATHLCIILGKFSVVALHCKKVVLGIRKTFLAKRLRAIFEPEKEKKEKLNEESRRKVPRKVPRRS